MTSTVRPPTQRLSAPAGAHSDFAATLRPIVPTPWSRAMASALHHDRRHMIRAVLEGVALNLAWLRPAVESFVGHDFPTLRFGGGGAQSDLWAQVLADALDRPVHQLEEPRATNARGAAFLAFATLGQLSIDDVPSLLLTRAVREPDPANRECMDAALGRLIEFHRALVNLTKF